MTATQRQTSRTYPITADDSPVQCVVAAVAAQTDRSPLEMPPLGDAVDPDALNTLLSKATERVEVTFEYLGHEVAATPEEVRVGTADHA